MARGWLGAWWRRRKRNELAVEITAPTPESQPDPQILSTEPKEKSGEADVPRVGLILEDGTSVLPPDDPELHERLTYLAANVIPGVGKSGKEGAREH